MDKPTRVLVVDDSAYVRKVVQQMLSRSEVLEVVGAARDGVEALELVDSLRPDVITLDLMMPNLDGVGFLKQQMARRPIPTVVVSIASDSGERALEALDAGAVDFIQKPTALATVKIFELADELIGKVKTAAGVLMAVVIPASSDGRVAAVSTSVRTKASDILVLGVSTGGPQALKYLIPQLPKDFPVPIAIVMHMPVGYTEMYAQKLNEMSLLEVQEAKEGDPLLPGRVLLAPGGRHLSFVRADDGTVQAHLDARPFDTLHRPSVDVLFRSAADIYKERVLGAVLTGMGSDGKEGAAWIKSQGGKILTEAEESCVVYGMPRSVAEAGLSDRSVPLRDMAKAIVEAL
jgi:two-component system, chemotaxis family, protein-glutamate methylesterase/glutaminase